jgi:hypothetical protein
MFAPLAYQYVAITLMLAEVNYSASQLHLPVALPVTEKDIKGAMVVPTRLKFGVAGRIDTGRYAYSFFEDKLCLVIDLKANRGNKTQREYLEELSHVPSTINTNDAYRIATNWLAALNVDLPKLERENPPQVRQRSILIWPESDTNTTTVGVDAQGNLYPPNDRPVKEVPLPLFDVDWRDRSMSVVVMRVSGSGQLLELRQDHLPGDSAHDYSKRPSLMIKSVDKLLAIPDAEFLKYSPSERSNLLAEFAGTNNPQLFALAPTNDAFISHLPRLSSSGLYEQSRGRRLLLSQTNAPAETNVPAKR